ncbi:unnamed protein product [Xylocopa violacea]|uniref:Retrovirus-related Pol polyprotein from type-2 retrotransposable element R2DM n=1 Tax=Xylocopa violacea TaxID=135666 RepID=A0ABP1MX96_XYLVO
MSPGYSVDLCSDLDCLSCPSCHVDLSSRSMAQRKQHIRRCNQPPPNSDGTYTCEMCSSTYNKYAGLRQHIKRAHPEDYNSQDLQLTDKRAPFTKAKWTMAEEKQLARLESQLPAGLTQKEISVRLADLHPGRSIEAIRKQRLKSSYRSIFLEIAPAASTTVIPSVPQSSHRDLCPLTPRVHLRQIGLTNTERTEQETAPAATTAHTNEHTCTLLKHQDICTYLKELTPSCSSDVQKLIDHLFNSTSFDQFDPYISSAIRNLAHSLPTFESGDNSNKNKRSSNNKKYRKSKHNLKSKSKFKSKTNRAAIRSATFSNHQRLFDKNPTQLAHAILDDRDINTTVFPPMIELEGEFRNLFEERPDYNYATPQSPTETIHLDYPVTFREVELTLRRLKQSASGYDGITREDLRAANMVDLVGLLNIVFGLCQTPSILRRNRTVMIPKKGDLSKPSNWRPITISSMFSRLLHKILASRLSDNIKLHHAQRGFTPGDGIMTNFTILDTIIREHRNSGKPLYVLSIDLTKAFDKIHPTAIEHALISKGIDQHTIKYIMSTYSDAETILECHGERSSPIKMRRGVRQGDTDSPILFNIVMDELVSSINPTDGVNLGEAQIGCLLFADDIILVSNTVYGIREHLCRLHNLLEKTHMEINPSKCRALQLARVPGTKRTAVETKPCFEISGKAIPTLKVLEQLKYLGHNYNQCGMIAPSAANLAAMLDRLRRAALRPWQKIYILNRYLIPRLMHCNQTSDITVGRLEHIDRLIRRFVKATLHLPTSTPSALLYAKIRDGGLSIPCMRHQIGVVYRRRMQRISLQGDPEFAAAFRTPTICRLMRKLDIICQGIPSPRCAIARHWAINLHQSALGNGLTYNTRAANSWILNPPPFWSGRDYIRAIQLRIGLLPTGGAPYINAEAAQCRYPTCVGRRETLSHILQWCPVTHYQRIQRHDRATQDIVSHLKKIGLSVHEAPRVNTRDNRYIPDLLVIDTNSRVGNIIETTVVWEHGNSLVDAARIKKNKYNLPEILDNIRSKYNLIKQPQVFPLVVGARGGWPPTNNCIWQHYKLPEYLQRTIVCNVLRYGSTIHKYFMAHTWRRRKKKKK